MTWHWLVLQLLVAAEALVPSEPDPAAGTKAERYLEAAAKKFTVLPKCEAGKGDEIVVCGSRRERSPYRLPPTAGGFDPAGTVDSVSRERHRLIEHGDSGIGSCSASGPGGYTGCFHRQVKNRCQQKPCGIAF